MLPYCLNTDISDEMKGIVITSGNSVTDAQVDEWILQESSYIDAKIVVRYLVPVNSTDYPDAYAVLKRICIFRVTERVKNKLEVKTNVSQLDSEQKYTQNYVRTPNYDLDQIALGKLILIDVPLQATNGLVNFPDVGSGECHQFDTSQQQW